MSSRLRFYKPYAKQQEFHNAGRMFRERLFMAGNQLGKTMGGAAECAMHLTGVYPDWWQGRRFNRPVTGLAGSESYELTRDGVQRLLVGPPMSEEEWGTGFIPKSNIIDTTRRSGVSGAIDTITVRHVSGGVSTLLFKAYEQGRGKWQANTVDFVWFDEEPPEDVYIEGITRTNATQGPIIVTFTPLMGMSAVVARYLMDKGPGSMDRAVINMTIDDAEHYTPEERQKIIDSYPAHEREARTKGVPSLGSGLIFPILEEQVVVEPFLIPKHWKRIGGMDFGYDHPFAAVECAFDADADVFYVTKDYRDRQSTPVIHAAAIRPWGSNLPWAWPHDGLKHESSGDQLKSQYAMQGLSMLEDKATWEDGGNGVEAGVLEMLDRMLTGRWKVFRTCSSWLEERRLYHRKDGKIVKLIDDVISASRYAYMMRRFAEPEKRPMMPMIEAQEWVA